MAPILLLFILLLATTTSQPSNALPTDDNPHSLSLSKLSAAAKANAGLPSSTTTSTTSTSTFAPEQEPPTTTASTTSSTTTSSPPIVNFEWPRVSSTTGKTMPSTVTDETTKRSAAKVRKVIKKLKRAKHWKALDGLADDVDAAQRWIPLWTASSGKDTAASSAGILTPKKTTNKSTKRIVCVHVAPSRQEQVQQEQFNLVRKCYSVKHIKRAEPLDTSSSSYSPIIDPNRMLVRSPVMAPPPVGPEWILPGGGEEEEGSKSETPESSPTTVPAVDVIPPTNAAEPEAPITSTEKSSKANYLNLYEYQTTNPLLDVEAAVGPIEKSQNESVGKSEDAPEKSKETSTDRLDQSPSEYFPIVTDIVTLDGQRLREVDEAKVVEAEVQAVANENAIERINQPRDLWQVNRRKKQLREMTMVSRSREHHAPSSSASVSESTGDTNTASATSVVLRNSSVRKSRKPIPKLLLPKVNRPAMYSLNGYVPKPSLHRVAAPPSLQSSRKDAEDGNKLSKASRDQKKKRQRANRKLWDDADAEDDNGQDAADDIEVSESVSRRRHSTVEEGGSRNSLLKAAAEKRSKKTKKSTSGSTSRIWPAPALSSIPKTSFECADHRIDGVYADVETGCQVWHVCQNGAHHSFLCPAGTIFNAKNGVCDWWYNTRCA